MQATKSHLFRFTGRQQLLVEVADDLGCSGLLTNAAM